MPSPHQFRGKNTAIFSCARMRDEYECAEEAECLRSRRPRKFPNIWLGAAARIHDSPPICCIKLIIHVWKLECIYYSWTSKWCRKKRSYSLGNSVYSIYWDLRVSDSSWRVACAAIVFTARTRRWRDQVLAFPWIETAGQGGDEADPDMTQCHRVKHVSRLF